MDIRIKDCIDLFNARKRIENKENGKMHYDGLITKDAISRKFWPNDTSKDGPPIRMNILLKSGKLIRPKWIHDLCKQTGTDPNFVFGFKSKHDEDFKKLVG